MNLADMVHAAHLKDLASLDLLQVVLLLVQQVLQLDSSAASNCAFASAVEAVHLQSTASQ